MIDGVHLLHPLQVLLSASRQLASRDVVYEGSPGSARSGAVGEAKR